MRVSRHLPEPQHRSLAADQLYREARELPGIKKVLIASGLRYDLAVEDPEYVKELVTHHVGGYLKIAPEHTERGPLSKMMKPGIGAYDRFKRLFEKYSKEAGKEQYLIPYFIAAHPGTTDEDMLNLALWLKKNGFPCRPGAGVLPSPMATATAMYHTGKNPLKKVSYKSETVAAVKDPEQRDCTRRSCATMTRTTGRCCARHSGTWAGQTSLATASISSSPDTSRMTSRRTAPRAGKTRPLRINVGPGERRRSRNTPACRRGHNASAIDLMPAL